MTHQLPPKPQIITCIDANTQQRIDITSIVNLANQFITVTPDFYRLCTTEENRHKTLDALTHIIATHLFKPLPDTLEKL